MIKIRKICFFRRVLNWLISLDQFVWSTITLGGSHPDETISSAMYRYEKKGKLIGYFGRPIIDTIFFFDKQHCRKSYLAEVFRLQSFKVNDMAANIREAV